MPGLNNTIPYGDEGSIIKKGSKVDNPADQGGIMHHYSTKTAVSKAGAYNHLRVLETNCMEEKQHTVVHKSLHLIFCS